MTDYLPSVYFIKLNSAEHGSGLTNQILSLVCSIIRAMFLNKKVVAIDYFSVNVMNNIKINISDIIDLKKTNEYLKEKYNIILLDKNKMVFKFHNGYIYDKNLKEMGILKKEEIDNFICKKIQHIYIPKNVCFHFNDDPHKKRLCFSMNYSLDNYKLFDNFNENLSNPICSNIDSKNCIFDFYFFTLFMKTMPDQVNDILKNIHFVDHVIPSSILNHSVFHLYQKVNVIHLRLEEDALQHWGQQNNMSSHEFKSYIETKYIGLIQKYVQKNELNVILTYSSENSVFDFLQKNGYTYFYVEKGINTQQREVDAITDLFLSTKCNNLFIGNFWMKTKEGSTFSYYILQKLENPNIKKVAIHLDNITDEEDVF